ncbi:MULTISPECIES: hypothetical protein [unclassified Streptomyces]|uniref:hypothetical protein n=1 Tax=unclassified Streptomyces TaxID=2593676 RepID=UPI00093AFFC0|nr:hypothetical protein [Streptomyces sp. TSRI0281]OKI35006.1 hypothetical protein A6A29_16410 [Streptomyces sp. TSRI0281]
MDATTATDLLTRQATRHFEQAETARTRLVDLLARHGSQLSMAIDSVLVAEAAATPWVRLMRRIDRNGAREALVAEREKAMNDLLGYGISLSTSLVTNAARLAEQDGLRNFLSTTNGMVIDEGQVEESTPEAAEEAAPTPEVVEIPKVTPAQMRTLAAVRDNGVTLGEKKVGHLVVRAQRGDRPRVDMVQWVISKGWAVSDASRSLHQGQPVTLTAVGEAILAG